VGELATRPWSAVRRLLARTPLRVKLTLAVLLLVAVALTLISVGSVAVLRGSLVGRLDAQLRGAAGEGVDRVRRDQQEPGAGPGGGGGHDGVRQPNAFLVQLCDGAGRFTTNLGPPPQEGQASPRLPGNLGQGQASVGTAFTVPATTGGGQWRVVLAPVADGSGRTVVAAASLDEIGGTIARLQRIDLIASAVVLLVLAGVGVEIVRASLRPLTEIEVTAGAIAAGDLSRRVPDRDPGTEVGRLGRALNGMLAQIEAAFRARAASEVAARRSEERMRRFVADASHELRTPLTTIRGFAELYRQGASRSPAELDRLLRRIEDQAAAMGLLVEDLLLLARLDQQRPLDYRPVDLLALAADAVHDARAVVPDRSTQLLAGGEAAMSAGPLIVLGDEARLRQVVANLMGNARTHTPPGTPVEVRVGTRLVDGAPRAVVEVVDHGPGLTAEQAERVFERFYRVDPARSHAGGGTGLGLAIVAALVAAHGGAVEVDATPGGGATFRVLLPLAPDATMPPSGVRTLAAG